MLESLAVVLIVVAVAPALLITRDVCRRHPVTGPLVLAGIALGIAVISWAAVPECDFSPCYSGLGQAALAILVFSVHLGLFGLFVIVALAQSVRRALRTEPPDAERGQDETTRRTRSIESN